MLMITNRPFNMDIDRDDDSPSAIMDGTVKIKVLVQPEDVQVKRVGRASCIEPDVRLCVECDSPFPTTVIINAYLKVLGRDSRHHKMILLRKSEDIVFTKTHRREIITMKLRFLKNIKVQVLKRNLGVSRPEAYVVFEAVNKQNELEGAGASSHFAIISDPRYLDEVKKRRATERTEEGYHSPDSDDPYEPKRVNKRRRVTKLPEKNKPEPECPLLSNGNYEVAQEMQKLPTSMPLALPPIRPLEEISTSPHFALQALKVCADYEFADSQEEEDRLIQLVHGLKNHQFCNSNAQVVPQAPLLPSLAEIAG